MKHIIVILLTASFFLQNIGKLIVVINYRINKEYIAENLCENRDEPESCCEGKCHLEKELDKEEKKENGPANTIKEKAESLFSTNLQRVLFIFYTSLFLVKINEPYFCLNDYSSFVFHPPDFKA